jgi:hypothetical protein
MFLPTTKRWLTQAQVYSKFVYDSWKILITMYITKTHVDFKFVCDDGWENQLKVKAITNHICISSSFLMIVKINQGA